MPTDFLTDDQFARYGRFCGAPSRVQLERYFFLDDADRALIARRRRPHMQLGFALQLGTVRFLGTFLPDPLDVPRVVVAYVAAQLGVDDVADLPAYTARKMTPYAHTWEIRHVYGYQAYSEAEADLRAFLAARAWTSTEGPSVLFERATAWLFGHRTLLPGASTLTKLVAAVRAEAAERLWLHLAHAVDDAGPELRERLERLLLVEAGSRVSALERLRTAPARISGPELLRALDHVAEIRALGAGAVNVSLAPPNRVRALARYGIVAKAPQLRQLTQTRRTAILLATAQRLEQMAVDDALDLLDLLMATKLLTRAARASPRERLRSLPRLTAASATLAAVVQVVLEVTATSETTASAEWDIFDETNVAAVSLAQMWTRIEQVAPRHQVRAALETVVALAPPAAEDADAAWRAELIKRFATVRPFLPLLLDAITFGAVAGADRVLAAARRLPALLRRKKVFAAEIATDLVTGSWKQLVYHRPEDARGEPGVIDHRAYAFCVLEHLHRDVRRRDPFVYGSDRCGDPRARLLDGDGWARVRPDVVTALGLAERPDAHLAELAGALDAAYRDVAAQLPEHPTLAVDVEGARLHLDRLEAEVEPPTLVALRETVARMLPHVDLPELLLDVHTWTGCLDEFTHLSESGVRMEDLALSVAAVLIADACNIGLRPVSKSNVAALRRDWLSHVDQNYVRPETIRAANHRLIEAQGRIALAAAWGGGLVASADSLRFVVPVATLNAGPNPRYFGLRRGATWLNAVNDRFAGLGGIVIPGAVRDSLHILDLALNLEGDLRPELVVTDTASYSDIVFGLFRLLGYQFAPRIADLADTRFWRIDAQAEYGPLNAIAHSRIDLSCISVCWPDMLRVAGSLATGAVRGYDMLRMLSREGQPSHLGRAFTEYGRIAKSLHLLAVIDSDDTYRRQGNGQLTIQESRHQLARRIFHGQRGELRQRYREGQEDQLGALGLVLNAVVLWNTRYLDAALAALRASGYDVRDEDVGRLSPLGFRHVNFLGRYSFSNPRWERCASSVTPPPLTTRTMTRTATWRRDATRAKILRFVVRRRTQRMSSLLVGERRAASLARQPRPRRASAARGR
jgi:TnpA family transposase